MKSDQINELAAALAKAQSKLEGADKNSDNPFFKSRYADLSAVWEVIRKPFADNGLSVSQLVSTIDAKPVLKTVLMHSSGQYLISEMPILIDKPGPQAMGSAISYARRYSLAAIAGVYQQDDDAEVAQGRQTPPPTPVTPKINPLAPVKPSVKLKEDDVPSWSSPPSGAFDKIMNPVQSKERTPEEWKSHVIQISKAYNWSIHDVNDEIKIRDFKKLADMTPNQIEELCLFIKGNPKK